MTKFLSIFLVFGFYLSSAQTADDYSRLGNAAEQKGNYREAIAQYVKAQKLAPDNAATDRKLGLIYYHLHNPDSAALYYTMAIKTHADDSVAYYRRGFCDLDLKEYKTAVDDFTAAFQLSHEKSADACYNIAKSYSGLENYDKALEYYTRVLTLQPNDKYSLLGIGNCYASRTKADKDKALVYYNKALLQDSNYIEAYVQRGILYGEKFENYDKAHQDFNTALRMRPKKLTSSTVYYYNGVFYENQKDFGNARNMFDHLLTLHPDYAEAYYRRAMCWYGTGVVNMACKDLDKADGLGFSKAKEMKAKWCK